MRLSCCTRRLCHSLIGVRDDNYYGNLQSVPRATSHQITRHFVLRNADMPREEIVIPDQTHTLACLIRERLFENDAIFAACVVPHPQDTSLTVTIEADDCKKCLQSALREARQDVEGIINSFKAHSAHKLVAAKS